MIQKSMTNIIISHKPKLVITYIIFSILHSSFYLFIAYFGVRIQTFLLGSVGISLKNLHDKETLLVDTFCRCR